MRRPFASIDASRSRSWRGLVLDQLTADDLARVRQFVADERQPSSWLGRVARKKIFPGLNASAQGTSGAIRRFIGARDLAEIQAGKKEHHALRYPKRVSCDCERNRQVTSRPSGCSATRCRCRQPRWPPT